MLTMIVMWTIVMMGMMRLGARMRMSMMIVLVISTLSMPTMTMVLCLL